MHRVKEVASQSAQNYTKALKWVLRIWVEDFTVLGAVLGPGVHEIDDSS